jgi:hypothetical protein
MSGGEYLPEKEMKIISSSHVHKILAVRGNYLLPIFFGFGSWAMAKAVHDGKNTVKLLQTVRW